MYCLTVVYPKGENTHFDMAYYQDTHIPLCARLLADHGYKGYVLRLSEGKGPESADLNYATVDLVFESAEQLQNGLASAGAEINSDVPNYTNVKPRMSFGEITLNI